VVVVVVGLNRQGAAARLIPPRHDRDIFLGRVLLPTFTHLLDHASDGKDRKIIVVIVIPIRKRKQEESQMHIKKTGSERRRAITISGGGGQAY
jgi:hypothetical protein